MTTSDYEWLQVPTSAYEPEYGWQKGNSGGLWVMTSENGPEYEQLKVAMSNYNIRLPYLWSYLTSEFHYKSSYSTLSFDNNWRDSFEDISKICWN